jgi:predicted dehydrogenase
VVRQLRVGMVGYAFMGKAHSDGYLKAPVFFPEISARPVRKAICGRNTSAVQQAAEQYGWESHETSWETLVRRDDIDLIDVSTPNNTHAPISIAAAQNGKHVFCEKPMAMSLSEAKEMLAAVREHKVRHMVAFNYRRVPAVAFAKQLIEKGKLGEIYHMRAVYLQDWITDPSFPLVWRLDAKVAGSGALGDLGAHILDLAYYLVGEIDAVSAATETFIKHRKALAETTGGLGAAAGQGDADVTVDDAFVALAKFKNGALGTFESTRFATGRKNYNSFEINGSKGSLAFNLERLNELQYLSKDDDPRECGFRNVLITQPDHPYVGAWWPPGHIIGWEHTHIHQIADLCDAVGKGTDPHPGFDDGVKNQAVLEAVEQSARNRQWVEVEGI